MSSRVVMSRLDTSACPCAASAITAQTTTNWPSGVKTCALSVKSLSQNRSRPPSSGGNPSPEGGFGMGSKCEVGARNDKRALDSLVVTPILAAKEERLDSVVSSRNSGRQDSPHRCNIAGRCRSPPGPRRRRNRDRHPGREDRSGGWPVPDRRPAGVPDR